MARIGGHFDGACVLAPFVPGDAVQDPNDIGIRLTINGEVRQTSQQRNYMELVNGTRGSVPSVVYKILPALFVSVSE